MTEAGSERRPAVKHFLKFNIALLSGHFIRVMLLLLAGREAIDRADI